MMNERRIPVAYDGIEGALLTEPSCRPPTRHSPRVERLDLPADPGLSVLTNSAEPGSPSVEAMLQLVRWSSTRAELTAVGRRPTTGSLNPDAASD
jgi:hypothetical protein